MSLGLSVAAPILSPGKDARGRPRKRRLGPWLYGAMKLLARFKWLRGRAFDPFGYGADRRLERRLIADYETTVERILKALRSDNVEEAADIAALPLEIRGYGPVKAEAADRIGARIETRLTRFERPPPPARPGPPQSTPASEPAEAGEPA